MPHNIALFMGSGSHAVQFDRVLRTALRREFESCAIKIIRGKRTEIHAANPADAVRYCLSKMDQCFNDSFGGAPIELAGSIMRVQMNYVLNKEPTQADMIFVSARDAHWHTGINIFTTPGTSLNPQWLSDHISDSVLFVARERLAQKQYDVGEDDGQVPKLLETLETSIRFVLEPQPTSPRALQ